MSEKPTPAQITRAVNAAISENAAWKDWDFYPVQTLGRTTGFEATNTKDIAALPEGLSDVIRDQMKQGDFEYDSQFKVRPGSPDIALV